MTNQQDYTKGQAVTVIRDWDNKGTYTYQFCTVVAAGKKNLILADAKTGEALGANFRAYSDRTVIDGHCKDTAIAACLKGANELLASLAKRWEFELAKYESGDTNTAVLCYLAANIMGCVPPRAIERKDASEVLIAEMCGKPLPDVQITTEPGGKVPDLRRIKEFRGL